MNDENFCSLVPEILEDNPATGLGLDVISLYPERRLGGVRVEVGEAAVPDLRHPGLCEPQVTRDSVLNTAHCRNHLCKEITIITIYLDRAED